MTPADIELHCIREFSTGNLQIGRTPQRGDRRERIRQAIYRSGKREQAFGDSQLTYAEAFRVCFGERLDRRAEIRETPGIEDDLDEEEPL